MFYSNGKGGYRNDCKDCHAGYVREKYHKRKDEISLYKEEHGCAKCGEKRPYCLDFHHIDPKTKSFTIARVIANRSGIESILDEIKKCVILCANCHREFHYLKGQNEELTIEDYLKK